MQDGTARWTERLGTAVVVALTALATAGTADPAGQLWAAERIPLDLAQRHFLPAAPADPSLTVVVVDDESLARLGQRWPLDRRTWADFLRAVAPHQPRGVLLDAWFEREAPRGEVDLALDLADALRDSPLGQSREGAAMADALDRRAADLDMDRALALALSEVGRAVLGVACLPPAPDAAGVDFALAPLALDAPGALECARLSASLPALATAASAQAGLGLAIDGDGTVRRYPYFFRHEGQVFPSIALEAARLAAPDADLSARALAADDGRPVVAFPPRDEFRHLRFSDVVEAEPASLRGALHDRVVFVGVSAAGAEDFVRTPREAGVPGVFAHAGATDALLSGGLVTTSGGRAWAWAGVALLALLALATARAERFVLPAALGVVGLAAWLAGAIVALRGGSLVPVVPLTFGVAAWLGVRLAFAWRRAAAARRQARLIRRAFQHYVPPAVVDALVHDPQRLRLGGERLEITAFFSDVQGFTGIAEQMPPVALVELLNEVLGTMSEAILEQGGAIDKYIGDAVVAMFGAPVPLPDHAARACRAALRCQRALAELRARLALRGGPPIHVRIGLNTGEALVGNLGSAQRFDFTMLGDSVNLASRLEGIAGQYGVSILVGEETARRCGRDFVLREVDAVRPKGKQAVVRLFELVGEASEVGATARERIAAWDEALAAYRARDFTGAAEGFARLAERGDGPAAVFLERTNRWSEAPPPETWDAVHTMLSK